MPAIPDGEYQERVERVQEAMRKQELDLLVAYGCECESANIRYLADFWPSFDFAGVVVPASGPAFLVTGGPESSWFAGTFSRLPEVKVNPRFVETSAPDWVPQTQSGDFAAILAPILERQEVKRVGIANSNIIPHAIVLDLEAALPGRELVPADAVMFEVRAIKSENEFAMLRHANRITEEAMKAALDYCAPGRSEWEVEARARKVMYEMGAEGTSYGIWVCSGPNTRNALCRSTDRVIEQGDLVQLTFGAKYKGYCGNMCRPLSLGVPAESVKKLMSVGLEAEQQTIAMMAPGVDSREIFEAFDRLLARHEMQEFALYGPAHGTGTQECEGPWLDGKKPVELVPGMAFNVDIWLSDGTHGIRFEDAVIITEQGAEELTGYRRDLIVT
jgi:Xaa-Pro aminopeptidase